MSGTKKPTTYEEQLEILMDRGLIIDNEDECLDVLHSINYYRFTAYLLPFKNADNTFCQNTSFERVYGIYEFDRKLRTLLFSVIEEIELYLRTQLAYYFAHKYGALSYLCPSHFNEKHNHTKFIENIKKAINEHRKTPIVLHHNDKYNGKFPIWVIVDFLSIGNLSYFFADLNINDKKHIARELFNTKYTYLESWLQCVTILRNICAHYSRLYFTKFNFQPKLPKSPFDYEHDSLFAQLLMLKLLYTNSNKWNIQFITSLESLIAQYDDIIKFGHIGFPSNWKTILEYEIKTIYA